ncbi:MAG: GYD domain-containing protein [Dehalococcoidia bacterium]|nr:MAG: GYD domain-containing protein [Dehalococcoidia bacterium]
MPSYLIQVGYTPEAWAAMAKKPQDRIEAVRPAIQKMGGKVVAGYMAFGEYDLVAIVDMPDNVSAAAFSVAAAAGGALRAIRTTPLLSTSEGIEVMKKAGSSIYKPPAARAAKK